MENIHNCSVESLAPKVLKDISFLFCLSSPKSKKVKEHYADSTDAAGPFFLPKRHLGLLKEMPSERASWKLEALSVTERGMNGRKEAQRRSAKRGFHGSRFPPSLSRVGYESAFKLIMTRGILKMPDKRRRMERTRVDAK